MLSYPNRPLAGGHGGLDIDVVRLANARPTLRALEFVTERRRTLNGGAEPAD